MEIQHEEAFVSAFVIPEKRERYAEFLKSAKRRGEILNRLNHFFDFVPALSKPIDRKACLSRVMRKFGAPHMAYIIGGGDADGKNLPLEEAIETGMQEGWGVVISCIPGRLALYIKEFPNGDAFLLHKPGR